MFSSPESNIDQFDVHSGMVVGDIGAGSGFYTLALAKAVGEAGHVYAVDVQKDLLSKLKNEANQRNFHTVETIWGDAERPGGTHLKDGLLDRVVISNILFQIEKKDSFVKEMHRILKPTGRALLIDWSVVPEAYQEHFLPKTEAIALFTKNGFSVEKDIRAGSHHYGIILRKI